MGKVGRWENSVSGRAGTDEPPRGDRTSHWAGMSQGHKEGAQLLPGKAGIKTQLFTAQFRLGFVASSTGCSQIFSIF